MWRTLMLLAGLTLPLLVVLAGLQYPHWWPATEQWLAQRWQQTQRVVEQPLQNITPLAAPAASPEPRKCVHADGRLVYTNQPCPAGSREQPMHNGSLTVVPR